MNHPPKGPCEPPFWKDPTILYRDMTMRYTPVCEHSSWNYVAKTMVLSLFIGLVFSAVGGIQVVWMALFFGFLTAIVLVAWTPSANSSTPSLPSSLPSSSSVDENGYLIVSDGVGSSPSSGSMDPVPYLAPTREHFVNGGGEKGSVQPIIAPVGVEEVDAYPYSGPSLPEYTPPTSRNLFMNVLVDEMKYNPSHPEAATVDHPMVKQAMDDYFRVQWFSDPTDVFGKNQGQRQFITQPSTTVPNDQGSFADWLYRIPGKTCKEGGRDACLSGTDGGAIPWLSHSS